MFCKFINIAQSVDTGGGGGAYRALTQLAAAT
jgi:hypothetical protein